MSSLQQRSWKVIDILESAFVMDPDNATALADYYREIKACENYLRAEVTLTNAQRLFPENRAIAGSLVDALIQQGKSSQALSRMQSALARFGIDDRFLDLALKVRKQVGRAVARGNRPSLSLCLIVKDEAQHLSFCLESVKAIVDEIVVVDTGSSDRTVDIAAVFGAKLYSFPWNGSFSDCRNYSLSKASCDWILVMDADEALSPLDHAGMLRQIEQTAGPAAFSIPIRNYSSQVNLLGWCANDGSYHQEERGRGWILGETVRVFTNHPGIRFESPVHETLRPSLSRLGVPVLKSAAILHHYGKLDTVKNTAKGEMYFELGRQKLLRESTSAEAVAELAIQAAELGKYAEAVPLWEKVLKMLPGCAEAHLNLGCCIEMSGGGYEALVQARHALQLKPGMKEAIYNCAKYELYVGDQANSSELIRGLVAREPEYPPALALQCATFIVEGNMAESGPLLTRLREMDFDSAGSLAGHASRLGAFGRNEYAQRLNQAAEMVAQTATHFLASNPRQLGQGVC